MKFFTQIPVQLTRTADVFHGTPEAWPPGSSPNLVMVGKGRGVAAHGWGIYFTEDKGEAEVHKGDTGSVYHFSLPDILPKLLKWNAPLNDQPATVKTAAADVLGRIKRDRLGWISIGTGKKFEGSGEETSDGREIYLALTMDKGSKQAASEYLASMDVPGCVYYDNGVRNYVIWDQRLLDGMKAEQVRTASSDVVDSVAVDMDDPYMAAVEADDMETAQRMVDEKANANGYTVTAYKGMLSNDWRTGKKITVLKSANGDWAGFFSSDEQVGKGFEKAYGTMGAAATVKAYLDMSGAATVDAGGGKAREFQFDNVNPSTRRNDMLDLINNSPRGVIVENTSDEATVYVPKSSSQVKMADPVTYDDQKNPIPLEKRFDSSNPDIRY